MISGDRDRANILPASTFLLVGLVVMVGASAVVFGAAGGDERAQVEDGVDGDAAAPVVESGTGLAANDSAGSSVAVVGDVTGDGTPDLLVGAPGADANGDDAGAAYLVAGPADPANVSLADADATFVGAHAGDRAGYAVAGAGDLNDDGYADLLVGAPTADTTGTDAGAAYVVYGGEDLAGEVNLSTADVRLTGAAGDHAGWTVAGANDSATTDAGVLVGAPQQGEDAAGAAYLVSNETLSNEPDAELETAADARLRGDEPGANAGWAVAAAGDVDGDGTGDLVVGAPNATDAASADEPTENGAAYVVPGPVTGDVDLADATLALHGESAGDHAGYAVAGAGDVNDDGVDDVLVGAPSRNGTTSTPDSGAAYVVYGDSELDGDRSLDAANLSVVGSSAGDRAGSAVAGGDVLACDGVSDVAIGAPGNASDGDPGAVYALNGTESGDGPVTLAAANATITGAAAGDRAGAAVAVGDVNGDGQADLVASAPGNDTSADERNVGAVYVEFVDCPDESGAEPESGASDSLSAEDASTGGATGGGGSPAAGGGGSASDGAGASDGQSGADQETSLEPVTAEIVCEDDRPYVFNPNGEAVEVTVDGPNGEETHSLGGGADLGGPSEPSFGTPNMAPGEYAVTAVDADGNPVPVNGESTYTTTVKECPTSSFQTECVDQDTVSVSFEADNLTGRHDVPVTFDLSSANPDDRRTFTEEPSDGTLATSFEVADTEQVSIDVSLDGADPDDLNYFTVEEGVCDDAGDGDAESDREVESIDATIICERAEPYVFNPNDYTVFVTIDGPEEERTRELPSGLDIGGPSERSHRSPAMTTGEYVVTAEDEDGNSVPVNGESTYTTTVEECPTTAVSMTCADQDTAVISVRVEGLTGRHAVPVGFETTSPNADEEQSFTRDPSGGVVSEELRVSDSQRVSLAVTLEGAPESPERLTRVSIDPGECNDAAVAAQEAESTPTPEDSEAAGVEAAEVGDDDTPTETETATPTATATPTESAPESGDAGPEDSDTGGTNETDI